jgi:hypothetical protein
MPAGDYFVLALDEPFSIDSVADGRALERLVPLARRISLEPHGERTLDLKSGIQGARHDEPEADPKRPSGS